MHLEDLSNAFGVSSMEDEVRNLIIDAARPYADDLHLDTMGNLFITRKQRLETDKSVKRVMVSAHMDEVGFMISEIKRDGLLKFKPIGGFDPRVLLGKMLMVGQERIPGVIGVKPIHLAGAEGRNVGKISDMTIDVGATGKSDSKVKPGDFATFATTFGHLGAPEEPSLERGLVKGKAFDNRVGCAMLLELLKEDYPVDLVAVFTVQEEIGLRGAKVAAYTANPDIAFVLECTAADDLPLDNEDDGTLGMPRLGHGPAITVMDGGLIADRALVDLLINTAEAAEIPHQFKRPGIGGTDGGAIHLAREGVPSVVVSVPARYIHAPAAVIDLEDFWRAVRLMAATLRAVSE